MTTTDNVTDAILSKLCWKTPQMDRYARAAIEAGIKLSYFNNDDVPDAYQPGDGTTVGACFKLLALENIIFPYRGNVPELNIYGGIRKSTRKECHGHRNQLYSVNYGLAREWLRRHGVEVKEEQGELL